jgi:hypothetical protein
VFVLRPRNEEMSGTRTAGPRATGNDNPDAEVFSGRLAGATFHFRTTAPDLATYARAHLAPLASPVPDVPNVDATLRWHDGQPPTDRLAVYPHLAGMERPDRDVYVRPGTLHWFRVDDLRDLYLSFRWEDQRLVVQGDFFYRVAAGPRRDWARRMLLLRRAGQFRLRRFTTLLYYLVYYPCWWWLERVHDLHPIHAGGVATAEGVILLAGASGVGKSTLAVALALCKGGQLVSDSFVLHHGTKVFAVREPVLLDEWSRRWLNEQAGELQQIDWCYCLDRNGYQLPAGRLAGEGQAVLVVMPLRAPEFHMRQFPPATAHQRLSAGNLIINDLRRYWSFAAVLELMSPAGLVARRESHLAELTAKVSCYEMGLTPGMTSTAAVEAITRLLREKPSL